MPAFENIHIYNALAQVLGVTPAPNDGNPDVAAVASAMIGRMPDPAARIRAFLLATLAIGHDRHERRNFS